MWKLNFIIICCKHFNTACWIPQSCSNKAEYDINHSLLQYLTFLHQIEGCSWLVWRWAISNRVHSWFHLFWASISQVLQESILGIVFTSGVSHEYVPSWRKFCRENKCVVPMVWLAFSHYAQRICTVFWTYKTSNLYPASCGYISWWQFVGDWRLLMSKFMQLSNKLQAFKIHVTHLLFSNCSVITLCGAVFVLNACKYSWSIILCVFLLPAIWWCKLYCIMLGNTKPSTLQKHFACIQWIPSGWQAKHWSKFSCLQTTWILETSLQKPFQLRVCN